MPPPSTRSESYARYLDTAGAVWWKRVLDVQAPYRWNMQRLQLGFTLEIGCGVGRNLGHLAGQAVGVDHNAQSVEIACARGFRAFTAEQFETCEFHQPGRFDSLLLSHVIEHMTPDVAAELVKRYLPLIKPGGRVVLITPQEAGWASDSTHVAFVDFAGLRQLAHSCELVEQQMFSFPFPRWAGRLFKYNEFVAVLGTSPGR